MEAGVGLPRAGCQTGLTRPGPCSAGVVHKGRGSDTRAMPKQPKPNGTSSKKPPARAGRVGRRYSDARRGGRRRPWAYWRPRPEACNNQFLLRPELDTQFGVRPQRAGQWPRVPGSLAVSP